MYFRSYERSGDIYFLKKAIKCGEQAVAKASADHPQFWIFLQYLGEAYIEYHRQTGDPAHLKRAISICEDAIDATTEHQSIAATLSALVHAYGLQYERTGQSADLDRAAERLEHVLTMSDQDLAGRQVQLSNLAAAYKARYERHGELRHLEKAIDLGEKAIAAIPKGYALEPALLANLGMAYRARHERRGESSDLERAIDLGEQAIQITKKLDPNRAIRLSNLGVAYASRHESHGVTADLERATELFQQALACAPANHPSRATWLSHWGLAHQERYWRYGDLRDLEQAIMLLQQAADAISDNDPDRRIRLSNLGLVYNDRFRERHELGDLERAIELLQQAADATPGNHPHRAQMESQLGIAYRDRYEHTRAEADLARAITFAQRAVAATPNDHPHLATRLGNVVLACHMKFDINQNAIGRENLAVLARQVKQATTASPRDRALANRRAGSLAYAMGENDIAVDLLDAAVALLPSISPRKAAWSDQEHRLGKHHGLISEAIGAHCAIDDPVGAIEIGELGRGILLATQLDTRTELAELKETHPELVARFQQLREELDASDERRSNGRASVAAQAQDRERLWVEHHELLDEIRRQPGFARFLLPPRLIDLQPAAAKGAVVLVNVSTCRGDAIILTSQADPIHVALPELTQDDVDTHASALLGRAQDTARLTPSPPPKNVLPQILAWLWDTIAAPVQNAIAPYLQAGQSLPRVWWMPTDVLGLLPLHAAGYPGRMGALDAFVSSYIPTLRVLADARSAPTPTTRRQLTVALEHTPGLPDLPNTVMEAADLHANHAGTRQLVNHRATTSNVLGALPEATWAHFACHAVVDLTSPSQGGLQLHDGILPIPDISRLHLQNAELAYLSACSTAHRGWQHADESIHLASAFQLAGFRHVIASLWPLHDRIAAHAARQFYRHLPATPRADHAATALHRAVLDLRAKRPDRPDLWASIIHSGP